MIIKTNQCLMPEREKITAQIAQFWDQISIGWLKIWGEHIHHGFYENDQYEKPKIAQEKLLKKLVEILAISPEQQVLDVGCGMGGSSLYLAKHCKAIVSGITLSKKQVEIATQAANQSNLNNVTFKIEDALSLASFDDETFDIVWSLESCEQFFDKNAFIKQAYRVLKPGGQLLLATWCSSQEEYEGKRARQYQKLCHAFDLPYMPTMEYYQTLLAASHFNIKLAADWSENVKKSWEVGLSLVHAYSFLQLLRMGGLRGLVFAKQIKLMHDAFCQDRVRYGVFLAIK